MRERDPALVDAFRQSTPYVNFHRGGTFVLMLGGEAVSHPNFTNIINDIALLQTLGIRLVLVFGARPQIDDALARHGITPVYHKKTRVTDEESLGIIKQVCGGMQFEITSRLSMGLTNTPMAGARISVVSGNFVTAQPLGVDEGVDYCLSGRIRRIDVEGVRRQLDQNHLVLISPIGCSVTGESFNLNSEDVAQRIAVDIKADKLICFSAHQGVLDRAGEAISELFPEEAQEILSQLEQEGDHLSSTARYLRAAIASCRGGVPRSHLVSFMNDGAMLQELFTREGLGTQIVRESAERARAATIEDIGGILELIRPMEEEGILVRRSREQLEMEIDHFTVIARDGLIIGCAALYRFPDEAMAEMACVAIHPDYRSGNRGDMLVNRVTDQARRLGIEHLFVLTTRSVHWFQERGFSPVEVEALPVAKQRLYNWQRRSKILMKRIS
ncbi:amino-acid N-acetyltransferase [Aeromonas simiae]|uniref:Amino-acid acetyltransferase n=1 Tax=Aeromonas simiae TaxID=218936 RepID=A0A5J6WTA4_9GAMM|nr:amino-acid N-acetyltransferase [Aeromonas simiae]MDO2947894.1 amino-acid N-acetyltransferase [Aeromonas simiae]MDO2950934.1 amino-acid N-acetyltransferase [Aeromonas simiae]MDO2955210.1 amino-acid N-acetyltransferase [Aeromonas simiae]QFI54366.1 amino-acid N-acetyltransferase [Aeromonas simiae]